MNRGFRTALVMGIMALPQVGLAGGKPQPPVVTREQAHPSGAFTFHTPESWSVGASRTSPDAFEAAGDGVIVRFVYRPSEVGFDSLHAECMLERLAGPMETNPRVKYEYDFLSGVVGDRRILDSAFVVEYDKPVQSSREWRQRNITLVGGGESLCVITYAPLSLWKKDKRARALLDDVVKSVTFRAPPAQP